MNSISRTKAGFGGVAFYAPKPGEDLKSCQDKVAVSQDAKVVAVADGVTASFQGGLWAECVVTSFAENPPLTAEDYGWFEKAQQQWKRVVANLEKRCGNASITKSRIQGLEPGSTTLVAVRLEQKDGKFQLEISTCGDACALVCRNGGVALSVPLDRADKFTNTPQSISSNTPPKTLSRLLRRQSFELQSDDTVILATDAMAQFLLSMGEKTLQRCHQLNNENEFRQFVLRERNGSSKILNDDVTLVRLTAGRNHAAVSVIPCSLGSQADEPKRETALDQRLHAADRKPALKVDQPRPKPIVMENPKTTKAKRFTLWMPATGFALLVSLVLALILRQTIRHFETEAAAGRIHEAQNALLLSQMEAKRAADAEWLRNITNSYASLVQEQSNSISELEQRNLQLENRVHNWRHRHK
jgi:serine/threonine protein phosphatase PrpC/FtsZ-binding cell division protein ZapB